MKTIAFIPMKLNNERVPNKNTLPLNNGKPLCQYIFDTVLKISELDEIYVYCSDPSIKDYLPEGIKYLSRSTELDKSTTPFNDVLSSFARAVPADVYLLTHTTAPFLTADSLRRGIEAVTKGGYDSAFSVKRLYDFLWKDGAPLNYELENIPRTQDLPPVYKETCGFFVYTRELILERNRRIGDKPCLIEISGIEEIDINDKTDFEIAAAIAAANGL